MAAVPVYFELSWSILSTIGLMTCCLGVGVAGIVGFSLLSAVPIIVSAACAIANGLCYYAFYSDYSVTHKVAAGAFADLAWLVQEAGLNFYSFLILRKLLRHNQRIVFFGLYGTIMGGIVGVRFTILIHRVWNIQSGNDKFQDLINHLHVAYFILIALAEILSAYFLLRTFAVAQRSSMHTLQSNQTLFKRLTHSTELRLALLAPIGITRSITYSFQVSAQSATNVATQMDRFAYSLECMFPIILIVDLLASKLFLHSSRVMITNDGHHVQTARTRIMVTATGGKGLENDEFSLRSPEHNEIVMSTQIKQTFVRLEDLPEHELYAHEENFHHEQFELSEGSLNHEHPQAV